MTEIEQLREAINYLEEQISLSAKLGRFMFSTRLNEAELYKANAKTLLTLLEKHGSGIQGLIDGTHWIAPNDKEEFMSMWFLMQPTDVRPETFVRNAVKESK